MMTKGHAEGATVVEYAVLLALIVIAILASVNILGHEVAHLFKTVAKAIR